MAQRKITRTAQWKLTAEYVLDIATDTVYDLTSGTVIDLKTTTLANGAKVAAIALPNNAVIEAGRMNVLTAFDHGGAVTAAIGDSVNTARYLAATSLKTLGITPIVATEYQGLGNPLSLLIAAAGANGTVGKVRFTIDFTIPGRANEITHYQPN